MINRSTIYVHGVSMVSIEHLKRANSNHMDVSIEVKMKDGSKGDIHLFLEKGTEPSWPVEIKDAAGKGIKIGKLIFHEGEKDEQP